MPLIQCKNSQFHPAYDLDKDKQCLYCDPQTSKKNKLVKSIKPLDMMSAKEKIIAKILFANEKILNCNSVTEYDLLYNEKTAKENYKALYGKDLDKEFETEYK